MTGRPATREHQPRTPWSRLILISAAIVAMAILAVVGLVLGTGTGPAAVAGRVAALFAISIAVGSGVQLARLFGSFLRTTWLERSLADPKEVLTAFWSPVAWDRLGSRRTSAAGRVVDALFSTMGVTATPDGITFWRGWHRPEPIRHVPWSAVGAIHGVPIVVSGRSYPYLDMPVEEVGRIAIQVESQSTFLPTAGVREVSQIARNLEGMRKQG